MNGEVIDVLSLTEEEVSRLPRSYQLMVKIERQARAKVEELLEDIRDGKTTLKEIKRSRGIEE